MRFFSDAGAGLHEEGPKGFKYEAEGLVIVLTTCYNLPRQKQHQLDEDSALQLFDNVHAWLWMREKMGTAFPADVLERHDGLFQEGCLVCVYGQGVCRIAWCQKFWPACLPSHGVPKLFGRQSWGLCKPRDSRVALANFFWPGNQ